MFKIRQQKLSPIDSSPRIMLKRHLKLQRWDQTARHLILWRIWKASVLVYRLIGLAAYCLSAFVYHQSEIIYISLIWPAFEIGSEGKRIYCLFDSLAHLSACINPMKRDIKRLQFSQLLPKWNISMTVERLPWKAY